MAGFDRGIESFGLCVEITASIRLFLLSCVYMFFSRFCVYMFFSMFIFMIYHSDSDDILIFRIANLQLSLLSPAFYLQERLSVSQYPLASFLHIELNIILFLKGKLQLRLIWRVWKVS